MQLSQIWYYPVKSCAGIRLESAEVGNRGIEFDRHWMLVDADGRFVTQRQRPRMALIRPAVVEGGLTLTAPGMSALSVSAQSGDTGTIAVQVWRDRCEAMPVSALADEWFSDFLGVSTRLVYLPAGSRRPVNPEFASPEDQVGFADGFPFLLITDSAVEALAQRMGEPLDARRFRPNLVVSGALAHAEDDWNKVRIGDLTFRVAKPCSRCIITTVNPDSAERDLDTLAALREYRQRNSRVYFGQNLIQDSPGRLAVGDVVEVID